MVRSDDIESNVAANGGALGSPGLGYGAGGVGAAPKLTYTYNSAPHNNGATSYAVPGKCGDIAMGIFDFNLNQTSNKVYSRAYADLPSDLVTSFKNIIAAKEITMAAVLRKEIEQYIEDNKGNVAKRKYNNKKTLRVYADLPKELVTEFREVVSENSETAASVLRKAIEKYVEDNE